MAIDPHTAIVVAVSGGAGYLMTLSGLQKSMLEFKRRRRVCPSCGRDARTACRCAET